MHASSAQVTSMRKPMSVFVCLLACTGTAVGKPPSKTVLQPGSMQKRVQTLLLSPSHAALVDVLPGQCLGGRSPVYERALLALAALGVSCILFVCLTIVLQAVRRILAAGMLGLDAARVAAAWAAADFPASISAASIADPTTFG